MTMRARELPTEVQPPVDSPLDPDQESDDPVEVTGMPPLTAPPKNRLTVVEMVYHQTFGEQPQSIESRFDRELQSDEQMYQRRRVSTEEWQSLDLGWVEDAGCIVIQNTEGQFLQLTPTPEQKAEGLKKVLEVAYTTEDVTDQRVFYVPPGESFRIYPSHAKQLVIRCQSGTAKYTVNVIPV